MIHKAIVTSLTAAACASFVAGTASFFSTLAWASGSPRKGWLLAIWLRQGTLLVSSTTAFGDGPAPGSLTGAPSTPPLSKWWRCVPKKQNGDLVLLPGTEFWGFSLAATRWLSPAVIVVSGTEYRFSRCTTQRSVTVPIWMLLLLFGSYPLVAFIRGPMRRYRRRKKGLCLKCGYNLMGNVSGTCPECGTTKRPPIAYGSSD